MTTPQVVAQRARGSYSTATLAVPLATAPAPGDTILVAVLSGRSAGPRAVTSITGLGATWTQAANDGTGRFLVFRGTGATAPGDVALVFSNSQSVTVGLWLLRGLGAAPILATGLTSTPSTAPYLGPVHTAGPGQVVLAAHMPSNTSPVTWPAGEVAPASGWSFTVPAEDLAHLVAARVPATTADHRLSGACGATPSLSYIGQVVLGAESVPASPPTNLRRLEGLTFAWDAPAAPPAPSGYEVRVIGSDLATTTGATTVDLATATLAYGTHTLEVRSLAPSGASAWVALAFTHDPPPPTLGGLRLEVGPEDAAVDLLGGAYSLTIRRGNAARGVTDTLEAGTLLAVIHGPAANPLEVAAVRPLAPVRVLAGVSGVWEPIFTATLDRARVSYDVDKADPDAYRVTLTASDVAPVLAATPHDTAVSGPLAHRVAHVLDSTGLPYTVEDPPAPAPEHPAELDTNERTAAGNLRLIADTAHGLVFVDRHNIIRVVSDHTRPRTPAGVAPSLLATDNPAAPPTALHYYDLAPVLDTAEVVNVLEVEHLAGDDTTTTTHTAPASVTQWGPHADTVTVNDGLPETHADLWLSSRAAVELRPEALALNVFERPSHLAAAVTLEPYDVLAVERAGVLPAPVPAAVRALEHTITADRRSGIRWLLRLELRPLEVLATRWDDVPPAMTWDDLDPTMTWDDAVHWHPYR